jgi:hypothetical protein
MRTHYEANLTMKEALAQYFQANNFGEDGGYHDVWVNFKLGPIPMPQYYGAKAGGADS